VEGHAYHLYVIEVKSRLELYNFVKENKIIPQIHYFPCHLMPYYKKLGWDKGDLPISENYYKFCISLPIYPSLSSDEQNYVISKINNFFDE
jgi:dTDP-4-amino-4,6-dideoxygalactose transaminase